MKLEGSPEQEAPSWRKGGQGKTGNAGCASHRKPRSCKSLQRSSAGQNYGSVGEMDLEKLAPCQYSRRRWVVRGVRFRGAWLQTAITHACEQSHQEVLHARCCKTSRSPWPSKCTRPHVGRLDQPCNPSFCYNDGAFHRRGLEDAIRLLGYVSFSRQPHWRANR